MGRGYTRSSSHVRSASRARSRPRPRWRCARTRLRSCPPWLRVVCCLLLLLLLPPKMAMERRSGPATRRLFERTVGRAGRCGKACDRVDWPGVVSRARPFDFDHGVGACAGTKWGAVVCAGCTRVFSEPFVVVNSRSMDQPAAECLG